MFKTYCAVVVAAICLGGVPNPLVAAEARTAAPALTVSVGTPMQRDWSETVPASGWLRPWQEAIVASETSGLRITDLLVDVGSRVTKGQTLARLSQDTVQADIRKQEAAVETARANLAKAVANADRARQLQSSGALSEQTILERLTDEQTARATLRSAEAALENERIRLTQTSVTAVDDGIITSRSALLGSVVSAGTELFRMIRQQRIEWQAEVSSRYLSRISPGMPVEIMSPEHGMMQGTVRLVGPSVSTDTGRTIVYVSLSGDALPRIGLYVTGRIKLRMTSALTVPETAVVFRDGMTYVLIVGEDKLARRVRVEIGRRNAGEVEITTGLDSSSRVVMAGGAFLADNVLVRVAEARQ